MTVCADEVGGSSYESSYTCLIDVTCATARWTSGGSWWFIFGEFLWYIRHGCFILGSQVRWYERREDAWSVAAMCFGLQRRNPLPSLCLVHFPHGLVKYFIPGTLLLPAWWWLRSPSIHPCEQGQPRTRPYPLVGYIVSRFSMAMIFCSFITFSAIDAHAKRYTLSDGKWIIQIVIRTWTTKYYFSGLYGIYWCILPSSIGLEWGLLPLLVISPILSVVN